MNLFIAISTILALISPIIYIRAILRGEAKPHRITRFTLLINTLLSTAALLAQHNQVAVYLSGVSALQAILIFGLSLKYGMGGWSKSDILCLLISLLGIAIWQTSTNPLFGLYASIAADFTGVIPTLIKTFRYPKTEIWAFFLVDVFAGFFSVLAIKTWTIQEVSYPIYIMIINLVMVLLIWRPHAKISQ